MTKKEVLREIIHMIDEVDQPDETGQPTRQPEQTELNSLLTDIYMLCEEALG